MKSLFSTVSTVLSLTTLAHAHMQMSNPPPLLSKFNKYTTSADYDMVSPLHADGSNFPCKNHHKVLGTSQGQPVAKWTPGQSYSMTITGGASHNGGSCQVSLSFDKGASWKVIHSYIGNCPLQGESSYDFVLPADTPSGTMLFAWTWFNKVGNREMYMNCAVIDVVGDGGKKKKKKRGTAATLSTRPAMFVANVGNGCGTIEGKDIMFPDPGPEVDLQSENMAPPTGQCAVSKSASLSPSPASSPSGGSNSGPEKPSPEKPTPKKPTSEKPAPEKLTPEKPKLEPASPVPQSLPSGKPVPDTNTSMTWQGGSRPSAVPPPMPSGTCTPGSFGCTSAPSGDGWKVCNSSRTWVFAGTCGPDQVCKFNAANGSPYCVPPGFQFP
ncbi:hypothetical protein E4U43_004649 [Claviceps pusilla]|uniref:Spore coat protein SP96 n=1 Tax=Claviceps pusilla TaxID=123648 RepID=A0A9P7NF46_9HYPO|nr:hypothetical protein E4U43_004649 [Claviceps pusilla]